MDVSRLGDACQQGWVKMTAEMFCKKVGWWGLCLSNGTYTPTPICFRGGFVGTSHWQKFEFFKLAEILNIVSANGIYVSSFFGVSRC